MNLQRKTLTCFVVSCRVSLYNTTMTDPEQPLSPVSGIEGEPFAAHQPTSEDIAIRPLTSEDSKPRREVVEHIVRAIMVFIFMVLAITIVQNIIFASVGGKTVANEWSSASQSMLWPGIANATEEYHRDELRRSVRTLVNSAVVMPDSTNFRQWLRDHEDELDKYDLHVFYILKEESARGIDWRRAATGGSTGGSSSSSTNVWNTGGDSSSSI